MSSITQTKYGISSTIANVGTANVGTNAQPMSYFNTDGSVPGNTETSRYAGTTAFVENSKWTSNNQGGNKMAGNAWTTAGGVTTAPNTPTNGQTTGAPTGGQAWTFANSPNQQQTVVIGGANPAPAQVVGAQPTVATSPSGANWATSTNPNPAGATVVATPGQPDLAQAAIQSIKNLAGKISEIVPRLNDDEFNDLVKIYELAGLKDEFLQKSGRQNSYLDRALLTEALNEVNMVFTENNNKNANLASTLNNMVNVLNSTGQYDARNVYAFIDQAMVAGVIPQSIWQDPMRQHLARVCQMAANHKRGGSGLSASGANWNQGYTAQGTTGYGAWAGTNTTTTHMTSPWATQNNNQTVTTMNSVWNQAAYGGSGSTTPTSTSPWAAMSTPAAQPTGYTGYQAPAAQPVAQTPWYQQPAATAPAAPAAQTPWYQAPIAPASPAPNAQVPWYQQAATTGTATYAPTTNYSGYTGYQAPAAPQAGQTFTYPATPGYNFTAPATQPTQGYGQPAAQPNNQVLGNDTCPVYM